MTRSQWLDLIGGLLLPAVCVVADPIVFRQSGVLGDLGGPLLQRAVVFGYLEILIGLIAFTLFLRQKVISSFLAGTLLVGAGFSLILGLLLLPFSVLGLVVVIGILGFTPLLSSFVFARACFRELRMCRTKMKTHGIVVYASFGAVLTLALPIASQMVVNSAADAAMARILTGESDATSMLRSFNWAVDLSPIIAAYRVEQDETRKQYLARIYEEISGTDIESRLAALAD